MATMNVDDSNQQVDSLPKLVGLLWESVSAGFIRRTERALAM